MEAQAIDIDVEVDDDRGAVTTLQLAKPKPKPKVEEESIHPEVALDGEVVEASHPDILTDLYDARILLMKAMFILNYMGNQVLSGKIGKKERTKMRGVAGQIKPYLEETCLQWEFEDDEVQLDDC